MKNKKGFSIFRVILYILFIVVTILIFTLTFNAIKEGNSNKSIKSDIFESRILMESPGNAPTTTSGVDFIEGILCYVYTQSTLSASQNLTNGVKVLNGQLTAPLMLSKVPVSNTTNQLDLSNNVRNFYWFMEDNSLNGSYYSYGYFSTYLSGMLVIKCNMPINMAKFCVQGSFLNGATGSRRFYYATNLDVDINDNVITSHYKSVTYSSIEGNNYYDLSSNLDSSIANATTLKYLAFPIYQSSSSSDPSYVALKNSYKPWLNSNTSYPTDLSYIISFESSLVSNNDLFWYNQGYNDALNSVDNSIINENYDLINQVNSLTSSNLDLQQQVSVLSSLVDSLQRQLNESNSNFKNLFFTIADVPFKTVSNVLGFEVLGVNLFKFFTGIITALAFIWLIKKII